MAPQSPAPGIPISPASRHPPVRAAPLHHPHAHAWPSDRPYRSTYMDYHRPLPPSPSRPHSHIFGQTNSTHLPPHNTSRSTSTSTFLSFRSPSPPPLVTTPPKRRLSFSSDTYPPPRIKVTSCSNATLYDGGLDNDGDSDGHSDLQAGVDSDLDLKHDTKARASGSVLISSSYGHGPGLGNARGHYVRHPIRGQSPTWANPRSLIPAQLLRLTTATRKVIRAPILLLCLLLVLLLALSDSLSSATATVSGTVLLGHGRALALRGKMISVLGSGLTSTSNSHLQLELQLPNGTCEHYRDIHELEKRIIGGEVIGEEAGEEGHYIPVNAQLREMAVMATMSEEIAGLAHGKGKGYIDVKISTPVSQISTTSHTSQTPLAHEYKQNHYRQPKHADQPRPSQLQPRPLTQPQSNPHIQAQHKPPMETLLARQAASLPAPSPTPTPTPIPTPTPTPTPSSTSNHRSHTTSSVFSDADHYRDPSAAKTDSDPDSSNSDGTDEASMTSTNTSISTSTSDGTPLPSARKRDWGSRDPRRRLGIDAGRT